MNSKLACMALKAACSEFKQHIGTASLILHAQLQKIMASGGAQPAHPPPMMSSRDKTAEQQAKQMQGSTML